MSVLSAWFSDFAVCFCEKISLVLFLFYFDATTPTFKVRGAARLYRAASPAPPG
jgi:hypothetical protein